MLTFLKHWDCPAGAQPLPILTHSDATATIAERLSFICTA